METITYKPIGIIHSPFKTLENMPIQPSAGKGIQGTIEIKPEFQEGLNDLDGFSHIYLIYHLHRSTGYNLKVIPFLDDQLRGLFSTRSPRRPNPLGISVVRLINIKENIITIEDLDILEGTPLLDIKPFVPHMYSVSNCKTGWLEKYKNDIKTKKSDKRFE